MGTASEKETLTERFKRFIVPLPESDCLLWSGAKHHRTAVGVFQVAPGHNAPAARAAYVMAHAEPLAPTQRIEPTCATGKFCVNGAHWHVAPRPRRRPSRIRRYTREAREELTAFAQRLGAEDVARLFGIDVGTVKRWLKGAALGAGTERGEHA